SWFWLLSGGARGHGFSHSRVARKQGGKGPFRLVIPTGRRRCGVVYQCPLSWSHLVGHEDMTAPRGPAAARLSPVEPGGGTAAATPLVVLPRSLRIRVCRAISAWLIRHPFRGANRLRRW